MVSDCTAIWVFLRNPPVGPRWERGRQRGGWDAPGGRREEEERAAEVPSRSAEGPRAAGLLRGQARGREDRESGFAARPAGGRLESGASVRRSSAVTGPGRGICSASGGAGSEEAIPGDRRGPHGGDLPQQRPACGKTGPARGRGAGEGAGGAGRGATRQGARTSRRVVWDQLALPRRRGDAVLEGPPTAPASGTRREPRAHLC